MRYFPVMIAEPNTAFFFCRDPPFRIVGNGLALNKGMIKLNKRELSVSLHGIIERCEFFKAGIGKCR